MIKSILLSIFLSAAAMSPYAYAETVTLTTGPDYPPFSDAAKEDGGITTRIVTAVFRNLGDTPVLTWLPWKRGYRDTQLGVQDVTFPYVKSPDREADFFYSDVIASNASYIWSRRGERGSTSNLADYKGKIICVPLGYDSALARLLKDMIDRHEVEAQSAPTPRNCAAMILARRVDYVSGGESEILGSPRDPGLEAQLVQSTEPIKKLEYFLMASKTNPKSLAIIARFNKELKQMRLDGRYRQLAPELF